MDNAVNGRNDNRKPVTIACTVDDMQLLGSSVYRIQICCNEGSVPAYKAGQYLEVMLPDGSGCAFSIASAPETGQKMLELHVQYLPDRPSSQTLLDVFRHKNITVTMPKGRCCLDKVPHKPLLFIAAGTGFAQIKSMVEFRLRQEPVHPVHVYWGTRSPADFYCPNLPVQWVNQGVYYHPVVSHVEDDVQWSGRHGFLYEAVLSDRDRFGDADIYISGSPAMVYKTTDALVNAGFSESAIYSDVFDYAPR
ncbi:CDP-6-deoxy-L-threo-D-glycero-4-hexulose-3-dehydrase reductase [invertebrate metagenome]|uniref:CDP-6-deoxy-L-threo-D-glycero-4-hexulose-3-dehydrase reductase n=1 Tax=invertebrate metagenome TaxID=1711999 RepID=A0A2H9TBQ4_9ZZZZ